MTLQANSLPPIALHYVLPSSCLAYPCLAFCLASHFAFIYQTWPRVPLPFVVPYIIAFLHHAFPTLSLLLPCFTPCLPFIVPCLPFPCVYLVSHFAFPSSCLAYPFLAFTLFHTLPSFHRALLTLDLYSALPHTLSSLHYHALPILALPFALPPTISVWLFVKSVAPIDACPSHVYPM